MEHSQGRARRGEDAGGGGGGGTPGKRTRSEQRYAAVRAADGSSGKPVPEDVQAQVAARTGGDLSAVRLHDGPASAAAAETLHADAYTSGQDIHFGAGKLAPETAGGQELLLHELGHALQHRGGGEAPADAPLEVSQPGDAGEQEADSFAASIASGSPAAMPGIAAPSLKRKISRWGEWCEDLVDDWFGDDVDDDSDFRPRFAAAQHLEVDYNARVCIPVQISNLHEVSAGTTCEVAFGRVDSKTQALLFQGATDDPAGGFLDFLATGVDPAAAVYAKVIVHHAGGEVTSHTERVAAVAVRAPAMVLEPSMALDNLVPGSTFDVTASFQNVHDPAGSMMMVCPRLASLGEGEPLELTAASWEGDILVYSLSAVAPGAATFAVDVSVGGHSSGDTWHLQVHDQATGGEVCTGFDPWFADPVTLEHGYNDRIEAPVTLLNPDAWSASDVATEVRLHRTESDGAALYADGMPSLTARGTVAGANDDDLAALALTADQEGTWSIYAHVTFTGSDGSKGEYYPQVATVNVGSKAARIAENQEAVDQHLDAAGRRLDYHKDQQRDGVDYLRDQLGGETTGWLTDAVVEHGAEGLAVLLFQGIAAAVAPGMGTAAAVVVDGLVTVASGIAGGAALAILEQERDDDDPERLTVARLRLALVNALGEAYQAATEDLENQREAFYVSPTGIADAAALEAAIEAKDGKVLQRESYLKALATWSKSLSERDAPWSDDGELRIKVRFAADGTVRIVDGDLGGLPDEVLDALRDGNDTIADVIAQGLHVEVFQTGDNHVELTSGSPLLASDYHTGSAAYFLVDRANAHHGASLDMRDDGAAEAAAALVWRHEILPLRLSAILDD